MDSFGDDENVLNWTETMTTQLIRDVLNTIELYTLFIYLFIFELYTLKWLILCYVIFTWAFKKNEGMYITCMPIYL